MNIGTVVVDASLALKWVLKEPFSDRAEELLQDWKERDVRTVAPGLLPYEVASALYERVKRGEMTQDAAQEGLNATMDAGPVFLDLKALHAEALRLARALGRPSTYESHYLALAEREDCELWTGDRRFWDATKEAFPRVRWVGEGPDRAEDEEGGQAASGAGEVP